MANKPKSYGDVLGERTAALNQARLADPDEHFPYKRDAARDALDGDPAKVFGVNGPREAPAAEFLPASIADASEKYVEAQQAYLQDPNEDTRYTYEMARDRLVFTRRAERVGRTNHGIAADKVDF